MRGLLGPLSAIFSLLSCISVPPPVVRNAADFAAIENETGMHSFQGCGSITSPDWEFPGPHRNLRIIQHDGQNVLLYEVVGPATVRTIWQTLDERLNVTEDGVMVGIPQHPHTVDFDVQSDSQGNTWAWYRFKKRGSEVYGAGVEFAEARTNRLSRQQIAVPNDLSVQQMWALADPESADQAQPVLQLIVRAYPSDSFESTRAHFLWFEVPSNGEPPLPKGNFIDAEGRFESVQFILDSATHQPVAVALYQTAASTFTEDDTTISEQHVTVDTIFSPERKQLNLFKTSRSILSSLQILKHTLNGKNILTTAWVNQIATQPTPHVQWVSLQLEGSGHIPEAYFTHPDLTGHPAPESAPTFRGFLKLRHLPADLHFRLLKSSDGRETARLAWLASLEKDIVYVSAPVILNQPPRIAQASAGAIELTPETPVSDLHGILVEETNISPEGLSGFTDPSGTTLIVYSEGITEAPRHHTERPRRQTPLRLCSFQLIEETDETGNDGAM
jgi:hypothetical protein